MKEQKKEKIILATKLVLQIIIVWLTCRFLGFEKIFFIPFLILNIIATVGIILKRKWGNLLYIILMLIGVAYIIAIHYIFLNTLYILKDRVLR